MKNIVGEEVLSSVLPKFQELVSRVDRLCSFADDFFYKAVKYCFQGYVKNYIVFIVGRKSAGHKQQTA
jgi:hypothetical protein